MKKTLTALTVTALLTACNSPTISVINPAVRFCGD
ncbi:lipoprotein [Histophilus somni]